MYDDNQFGYQLDGSGSTTKKKCSTIYISSDMEHLLQTHGILKAFNVNRKVTKHELAELATSMGIEVDDISMDELSPLIQMLSEIELIHGEIPGTPNSSSKSLQQLRQNYQSLFRLVALSSCVCDLLDGEQLSQPEKLFVLNKCIVDIQQHS